jgi:hypothetical protein
MINCKEFKNIERKMIEEFGSKKIILSSFDRLHPISGIYLKLKAYR